MEELKMPPIPEGATVESLWEKLHHERRMWKDLVEQKDKETDEKIYHIRHVADIVIARFVRSFGTEHGEDGLRLDIPAPRNRDGHAWVTKTEVIDDNTWRIWAREIEIPEIK